MSVFTRATFNIAVLVVCLLGFASAARSGLSRFFSATALANNDLESANEAVRLEPADPRAHYVMGLLSTDARQVDSAIENFRQSARLRSRDYSTRLQLGLAQEAKGNKEAAIEAFSEAVRLAPYYSAPRWQLGNALLRAGRLAEGFVALRFAAQSDPSLLPEVIELAWKYLQGDASKVRWAIQPETDSTKASLASFFVRQNRINDAVELLRTAGDDAEFQRYTLTVELIEANRFSDAAEISRTGKGLPVEGQIVDGGFEDRPLAESTGFVWQGIRQSDGATINIDKQIAQSGSKSLTLTFEGSTYSEAEFVKQLVILAPHTRYQLDFASRSQNLVASNLPFVAVLDAMTGAMLARSSAVASGTAGWSNSSISFQTGSATQPAYIIIRREKCLSAICPIFGQVWFDSFSLKKL